MLTTIVLAGVLLTSPQSQADKWDIKSGLAPKTSTTWNMSTNVMMGGDQHTATMKLVLETKEQDGAKPLAATISWKDLTIESGQAMDDTSYEVTLDPHGMILDSSAQEGADAIRKTLSPFVFAYPDAPVGVGDTWSATVKSGSDKSDQSITEEMKADSMDKIGDVDALKVTETLSQKGDDGLKGTGTWWVDKSGKILKFEVSVSNWEIPLLPGQMMDAQMKGELSK